MRIWFPLILLSILVMMPLGGQAETAAPHIEGASFATLENGNELLSFKVNEPIEIKKSFTLAKPNRVAIDLPKVSAGRLALPKSYKGRLVKAVRFGQFNDTTSRLVLEVTEPVTIVAAKSGAPFTIELAGKSGVKAKPGTKAIAVEANSDRPQESKPLIVIDAGHGGQDPGAIGKHGTREKDVTLSYARALREALLRTGRYRVALTREDDRFIMLHERVAIARKMKGDLFISFHADSNPNPEARGLSIYTVSENASDEESAALAERENKVDILPGINLNTADPEVANILIDLTQRETMKKSDQFADDIVKSFDRRINRLDRTHRFAGFRVLKGFDVPSVLIELGFLTNDQDERMLLTAEYRDLVVNSVVKGIDRYLAGK